MRSLFLITFTIGLAACNSPDAPDCLKSAGDLGEEIRTLDAAISSLIVEDLIHVNLHTVQPNEERVILRGPSNLLPGVSTSFSGGTLHIQNENRCNWVRDFGHRLEVDVFAASVQHISYLGQGDVICKDTLTGGLFTLENRQGTGDLELVLAVDSASVVVHTGYSNVKVSGSVISASLFNQGFGRFDAGDFDADVISCNQSSINEMIVRSRLYLYAAINSRGNVMCYGAPEQIEVKREGSGQLFLLED